MSDFSITATAALAGRETALDVSWSAPASQPRSLRVVRRRGGYPAAPDDGRVTLDLADLFVDPTGGPPWGRVEVTRFLLDNGRADDGAVQAEMISRYAAAADAQPQQIVIRLYPAAGGPPQVTVVPSVTRVAAATGSNANFANVATLTIFARPTGGTEAAAGTAVISTGPLAAGPVTTITDYTETGSGSGLPVTTTLHSAAPNQFAWTPATPGTATLAVAFAGQEQLSTVSALETGSPLRIAFTTSVIDPAAHGNLPVALTGASNETPIVVTTAGPHGLHDGAWVSVGGVAGNTAANGTWQIGTFGAAGLTLVGSTGNGVYAGGGILYPPVIRTVDFVEQSDPVTTDVQRSVAMRDRESQQEPAAPPFAGLEGGIVYYYGAFQDAGAGLVSAGAASVLATSSYEFADRLFQLLPAVHRFYDDPASGHQGSWQLRRFLGVFGPALDYARSATEALPSLYDPFEVRAEFLPYLAQTIGWNIDRTLPTDNQRSDLLFAPEVFATIGTPANVQALATRTTGWGCQVKEFVGNVLLTNAVEPIRLWQLFQSTRSSPGQAFAVPALQANLYPLPAEPAATQADPTRVDARPAATIGPDNTIWLFFHSLRLGSAWQANTAYSAGAFASILAPLSAPGFVFECTTAGTSGAAEPSFPTTAGATVSDGTAVWTCRGPGASRRRIWLQRLGSDPTPVRALGDLADGATLFDETPAATSRAGAVWLAWASNRDGHNEIWVRAWSGAAMTPGPARQLTHQRADARNPALACAGSAASAINLVWQSTANQTTALWSSSSADGATWSDPTPVSRGPLDRMPAAVIDASGQLNVFWSADQGDASRIRRAVQAGGSWTVSDVTAAEPLVRDEAPAAVLWNGAVQLFWHSNRFAVPWQAATAYALGALVVPPAANGAWYQCTRAGSSGAAAPPFPTLSGASVADGTVIWTCRGSIAAARLASTSRIWSATGPSFTSKTPTFGRLTNDRQPAVVAGPAAAVTLFFTSQEKGARFQSRTFDTRFAPTNDREATANRAAKDAMHTYPDRLHYTYDTRRAKEALVARDTVGLYLTPNDGQTDVQHAAATERLRGFIAPFRPVSTRLVYLMKSSGAPGYVPIAVDP